MFDLNIFFFAIIYMSITFSTGTKWLIDNPGFYDSKSWLNDYLPCARETVVFPEKYPGVLPLPELVEVGGFVLPVDGAILLNRESTIVLKGESKKRSCDRGKAYIRSPNVHKWFDPTTWRSIDERKGNKAIPALEKIPCNNESVVIQNRGPLAFDLENVPYLRMGQLSFAGSLLSKDYVRQLLYTNLGELLFRNQAGVRVEYYYNDVCGCHRDYNHFLEPVCHNVMKSCEKPHCQVSIVPLGSCCSICGSLLSFKVGNCDSKRLHTLQTILERAAKEQNLQNDLDYHVNYYSSKDYGIYLQAIIVDRKNYNEKSVNFVKSLNSSVNWIKKLNLQSLANYKLQYSGRPYNPDITFGSVVLIILCVMLCAIVALIIFAHYVPHHRYLLYIPQWMYDPRRWVAYNWRGLLHRSNFMFARFDNARSSAREAPAGAGGRMPVVMGYDAENDSIRERAFDNPMFSEEPAALAKKPVGKKNEEVHLPTESVASLSDKNQSKKDEQELTEIKLISSSEGEDTEEETVE